MALGKLFRALPPRRANPEELMESYLIACHKCTKHAIEAVVIKLIRGELKDMPKAWAPSPAELSSAIRDEMDFVQRQVDLAAERQMIEDKRPVAAAPRLFEQRAADAKAKMEAEGRRLLFEADSFNAAASSRRNLRPGSIYVGILGAWYGPEGSLYQPEPQPVTEADMQAAYQAEMAAADAEMQEILRADMFEPEPTTEPEIDPPAEQTDVAPAQQSAFEEVEF
ncbi:hypothetical protein HFO65_15815 [Rhizobium laguerreae]|uniref:hypothetical protein n=1 Tax=Rhizobium laguerreae TaxID=1076926 RepID=UPI001C900658|nr:hypothetical protein [Rhizobium laguerreae]MBY3162101.1 hypothetical protein [Rhizobium laguerreae]